MKENGDGAPEVKRWSWKITVPVTVVLLLAVLWGFYGTDEKLRPWDDLKLSSCPMPDPAVNGYQFLKDRWEGLPNLDFKDRELVMEMARGTTKPDPALLAKLRKGRENTHDDFSQALDLPVWLLPPPLPCGPEFAALMKQKSTNSIGYDIGWIMGPIRVFGLEAAIALQNRDPLPALAHQGELRRFSTKLIHGCGGLRSWGIGLDFQGVAGSAACDLLERNLLNSVQLDSMQLDWLDDPQARDAIKTTVQVECVFFDEMLDQLTAGKAEEYGLPELSPANRLRFRKNGTRNLYFAKMRRVVSAGLLPYPDKAAFDAAVPWPELDPRPGFLKELDPNSYGLQVADSTTTVDALQTFGYVGLFIPRAMRVRIALQRWRLVNPSKWPASLTELVPDFLPAVPEDPWNGKRLLWDPADHVIYAVGSDWRDNPPSFPSSRTAFSINPESPGLRLEMPPVKP